MIGVVIIPSTSDPVRQVGTTVGNIYERFPIWQVTLPGGGYVQYVSKLGELAEWDYSGISPEHHYAAKQLLAEYLEERKSL